MSEAPLYGVGVEPCRLTVHSENSDAGCKICGVEFRVSKFVRDPTPHSFFFFVTLKPISLKYEPSSDPLHIYVKQVFLN